MEHIILIHMIYRPYYMWHMTVVMVTYSEFDRLFYRGVGSLTSLFFSRIWAGHP